MKPVTLLAGFAVIALAACEPKPDSNSPPETPVVNSANHAPTKCRPAGGMFNFLLSLGAFDDWSQSPILPLTIARMTPLDGKPLPEALIFRFDGQDTVMPVNDDGRLVFNISALDPDGGGELCIVDPARVDDPPGGLDFNLNVEFVFKTRPGGYDADLLAQGAATTNTYLHRTITAATGNDATAILGPTDWLIISRPENFDGDWTAPKVAIVNGSQTVHEMQPKGDEKTVQFPLAKISEYGGDGIHITGGAYKLAAIFDLDAIPENYKSLLGVQ